jgi:hypothetical protein
MSSETENNVLQTNCIANEMDKVSLINRYWKMNDFICDW